MMAMSAWMRSSLCRKIGRTLQGLFEVAVALFDDPLVFVGVEHVERGQRAAGWVGQVGGEGVEPVQCRCGWRWRRGCGARRWWVCPGCRRRW